VEVFPQDGSRFRTGKELPDALVFSTAIEEDNPDFLAAGDIPRLHRSEFLRWLLEKYGRRSIAVTGSCGKSSVTAYITETLDRLGADPVMISGGLSKRYRRSDNAGNFRAGDGEFLVFEADESDKSLLAYGADYAVILNIGTDHYEKEELVRVFREFLNNIRCGAVISRQVADALDNRFPEHLTVRIFDDGDICRYTPGTAPQVCFADGSKLQLPAPGRHVAMNALAIRTLAGMLGFDDEAVLTALHEFDGVWRRNDFAGKTPAGTPVYDDYAHNPEKIISCLSGMREAAGSGRLFAVFQPHGYKPFGFMADALGEKLAEFLGEKDRFILLEPFYAGGTSSFSPHSEDICRLWQEN
jgi:UDP-N-acetylmuramate--alanine ligase